jgi:transcriptional regulator with XRE-family HTH domain
MPRKIQIDYKTLKDLMDEKGVTVEQIAVAIGKSTSTVRRKMRGGWHELEVPALYKLLGLAAGGGK